MRRLNVTLPDANVCKTLVEDLKSAGVPESPLQVVAGAEHSLTGLREATVWQRTELTHGLELGVGLGGGAVWRAPQRVPEWGWR